jgi:HD-GYP domain-containing protein (c-di-GMP phosphodiesterase class II)
MDCYQPDEANMSDSRIRLRALAPKFNKNQPWDFDRLVRIGRAQGVEVVLNDASVSRYHAEITFTDQVWVARDLGSTNGTFLNGTCLGRTGQPVRPGDILQCGNVVLHIEALTDQSLNDNETPCDGLQVQAVAQQSLAEAVHMLAQDITRSTRPGEQLLSLLQAGQFLNWTDSLDELLARNLQEMAAMLGARRGAVVLIDAQTGKMKLRAAFPAHNLDLPGVRFYSQTLARRCLRSGQSLLCADVVTDPELLQANSIDSSYMSSVICALLRSPRRYLGILHLDRGLSDEPFTRDDLHRADALAANLSFAFENAQQLQDRQQALFLQTVIAFSQVIELRDPYTGGHAQRVTDYALLLAEQLKLSETDLHHLRIGAPLHDIGTIGIDDAILRKTSRLTDDEFEQMKRHTVMGAALIRTLPGLDIVLPIVRNHHERWDGQGYPDRLAGDAIPPLARLLAVADTFDAMTTDRPYRSGLSIDQALAQIESGAGSQFDPAFAHAFLALRPTLQLHLNRKQGLTNTIHDLSLLQSFRPLAAAERRLDAGTSGERPALDLPRTTAAILAEAV